MKKLFNLLLISFASLLVIPNFVNAEVKEFGDYKYTIEESTYKDYVCDEIEGKDYHIESYDNYTKLVLVEIDSKYLIDFSKSNNCESITDEEYDDIISNSSWYSYYWDYDNTIKEVSSTAGFILTSDAEVVTNKTYYRYDEDAMKWLVIDNPVLTDIATYYERIYISSADDYDLNETYYTVDNDGKVTKVDSSTKEEFDKGEYRIKDTDVIEKTILTLNEDTKFILPSEKNGNLGDYTYEKIDLIKVQFVDDKTYLIFHDGYTGELYLYNIDGTLVDMKVEYDYIDYMSDTTGNGLFALYLKNDIPGIYVMDKDLNVIFEEENENVTIEYLTTIENTDYFEVIETGKDLRIVKITKEKLDSKQELENESVPNTYDGVTISIILGIISLIGLVLSILYVKRKQFN